jgi:hypothetical protein
MLGRSGGLGSSSRYEIGKIGVNQCLGRFVDPCTVMPVTVRADQRFWPTWQVGSRNSAGPVPLPGCRTVRRLESGTLQLHLRDRPQGWRRVADGVRDKQGRGCPHARGFGD